MSCASGRGSAYVSPVRLYLASSAAYFATSLGVPDRRLGSRLRDHHEHQWKPTHGGPSIDLDRIGTPLRPHTHGAVWTKGRRRGDPGGAPDRAPHPWRGDSARGRVSGVRVVLSVTPSCGDSRSGSHAAG